MRYAYIDEIETSRLLIRHLDEKDAGGVMEILGDEETAHDGAINPIMCEDGALAFIHHDSPGCQNVGITWKDSPEKLIGLIEIYPAWHIFPGDGEQDTVSIGYFTGKGQRGRGVMTEAVMSVSEFLFSLDVPRLLAGAFPDNAASKRVLEKCGFRSEFFLMEFPTEYGTLETVEFFSRESFQR